MQEDNYKMVLILQQGSNPVKISHNARRNNQAQHTVVKLLILYTSKHCSAMLILVKTAELSMRFTLNMGVQPLKTKNYLKHSPMQKINIPNCFQTIQLFQRRRVFDQTALKKKSPKYLLSNYKNLINSLH